MTDLPENLWFHHDDDDDEVTIKLNCTGVSLNPLNNNYVFVVLDVIQYS